MECPDCGAFVSDEDLFCEECGRPLEAKAGAEAKPVRTQPSSVPDPGTQKLQWWRSRRKLIFAVQGVLLLFACAIMLLAWWLIRSSEPPPVPTPSGPEFIAPVYEEDFADPTSGWSIYSDDNTLADYVDGEYRLAVFTDNLMTWGNPDPGPEFGASIVEVDARLVQGPLDNNFGPMVRYQEDADHFLWFQISSNGYYKVLVNQADDWITLVDWNPSEAILQGVGATNRLQVFCSGHEYVFFVNGTRVAEVRDEVSGGLQPVGGIGLAAGTFDEPGVVIHFDNLRVYSVEE
jgi:hypothetical protein